MPAHEFSAWIEYLNYKGEEEKKAHEAAAAKARSKRKGS